MPRTGYVFRSDVKVGEKRFGDDLFGVTNPTEKDIINEAE